jgi:PiT family inorganic phosphate transporter|tara:strand:+ start:9671 stop:10714 length:1044 start_codon:yes stop_codon:yes gene_type:complete
VDSFLLVFLSGGLFLGWALGANDAANVFGTAVGTRMVRFVTAAAVCSVFLILGAVISGAGPAETLGKLAAIDALPDAFIAAVSAGLTVFVMTRWGLPVSTSQAIVGALVGWNFSRGIETDLGTLTTIISTWILCPLLAGAIAAALLPLAASGLRLLKPHLLLQDAATRWALLLAGAFGAYSLGASNIANVMGPFVHAVALPPQSVAGLFVLGSAQQLFLFGGLAIALGVFTYSRRVMMTVGKDLFDLSPMAAWVAVMAHSIVLFLFASKGLAAWLAGAGLPQLPLVPVSSSQAVVGAVLGIGLLRGAAGIRWQTLGGITVGWVATPVCAGMLCGGLLWLTHDALGYS